MKLDKRESFVYRGVKVVPVQNSWGVLQWQVVLGPKDRRVFNHEARARMEINCVLRERERATQADQLREPTRILEQRCLRTHEASLLAIYRCPGSREMVQEVSNQLLTVQAKIRVLEAAGTAGHSLSR